MIVISFVEPTSDAFKKGLREGDRISTVNRFPAVDMLDLLFYQDTTLVLTVEGKGMVTINPRHDDELPLGFQVDDFTIRPCINDCIFCFVSQMKQGCRKTLYVKDDDYRTSFLYGAYITLSNLTEADLERINRLRLSPLYVSVHAVDHELYTKIIRPKKEFSIKISIENLLAMNIRVHTQLVLMPGINDGKYLEESLDYLSGKYPQVETVTVVPVGLTNSRDDLPELRKYTPEEALDVLAVIETYQQRCMKKYGEEIVYATDEFYITAGLPLPEIVREELIDNGVGMYAMFKEEYDDLIDESDDGSGNSRRVGIVTGHDGAVLLRSFIDDLNDRGYTVTPIVVENRFFGDQVTVTGLLTGRDIIDAITACLDDYDRILVPDTVLNTDGFLLDDLTQDDIEKAGNGKIVFTETNAEGLINGVIE